MNIEDEKKLNLYLEKTIKSNWSVRQLERFLERDLESNLLEHIS